jgi:HPt (histidine-containing phosphotransfer) domain-containing protein
MKEMDYDAALARVGGDKELLSELAGLFLEEYPQLLDSVRVGFRSASPPAINGAAHQLKGLLAQFGAERARAQAQIVEQSAKAGDLASAAEAFADLEFLMGKLHPELLAMAGQS